MKQVVLKGGRAGIGGRAGGKGVAEGKSQVRWDGQIGSGQAVRMVGSCEMRRE